MATTEKWEYGFAVDGDLDGDYVTVSTDGRTDTYAQTEATKAAKAAKETLLKLGLSDVIVKAWWRKITVETTETVGTMAEEVV